MTYLRPLFETTEDPLERALLASALDELPSASSLHHAALGLGLTVAAAKALAATLPTVTSVAGGASASLAPSVVTSGSSTALATGAGGAATWGAASLTVVTKGIVGGAAVSFFTIGALHHAFAPAPTEEPASSMRTSQTLADATQLARAEPSSAARELAAGAPTPEATELAAAPSGPQKRSAPRAAIKAVAPAPVAAAPSAPPISSFSPPAAPPQAAASAAVSGASLATEIRLLDEARTALAGRDLKRARRLLDIYAASRPSGVLAREATLLRVRLLLAEGQKGAAIGLARATVAQHPESADVDLRELAKER